MGADFDLDGLLASSSHPWGNIPNGYSANAKLGDAGTQSRSAFSGMVLDNLAAYGHHQIHATSLDWTFLPLHLFVRHPLGIA